MTTLSYLYQLQDADFDSLSQANFRVAVVDRDDSKLTLENLHVLQAQGRTLFSYLSIGEAEDYRDYWISGNWGSNPPSFLLGENPDWEGNYSVKFWDPQWQELMVSRVRDIAAQGYNGVYLDIVDAYQRADVIAAYGNGTGAGQSGNIRLDMENFIIRLSQEAKAVNPIFKIIPQNAVELLADANNDALPNTRYLAAIDGVGKEDTFYNDNQPASWSPFDVALMDHAVNAGKFILAIDYPTQLAKQQDFLNKAINEGYIPFVGERDLDNLGPAINETIPSRLNSALFNQMPSLWLNGTAGADTVFGGVGHDWLTGNSGNDSIYAASGNDSVDGGDGNDLITGDDGNDIISGGNGNDLQYGWTGNDTISGGAGDDFGGGDDGNDSILGGIGNDTAYGWTGDDTLDGGDGHDWLFGDAGNDSVIGGTCNDTMFGWTGADTFRGGDGNDFANGDQDNDSLFGEAGDDTLFGGDGNDTLTMGEGNNVASGEAGNDSITAGSGVDSLYGGDGVDTIFAGAGNDYIDGGAARDHITGGAGADYIIGGEGADIFRYQSKTDSTFAVTDFIQDFVQGTDLIDVINAGYSSIGTPSTPENGSGRLTYIHSGGNTIVYDAHSNFAILLNGTVNLTASDFIFA